MHSYHISLGQKECIAVFNNKLRLLVTRLRSI